MAKTKAKTVKKAKPAPKAPAKKAAAKKPASAKPEAKKATPAKKAPAKPTAPAKKAAAPAKQAAPAKKATAPAKPPAAKPKGRAAKPTEIRDAGAPPMPGMPAADDASRDELNEATYHAMDAAWSKWGTLDPNLLTHLLNPSLAGGPRWPGMRQAYRVARQNDFTMLASDGLATPYDPPGPPDRQGLGLEVFAVTNDEIEHIPGSWIWGLVYHAAQLAADHGGLAGLIDELGVVSSELYNVPIPPEHAGRYVNEAGRVGVLLGIEDFAVLPPRVDGPLGTIRLVNVKLLTLSELAHVLQHGEAGRKELARRFGASPGALVSSLTRPDVA